MTEIQLNLGAIVGNDSDPSYPAADRRGGGGVLCSECSASHLVRRVHQSNRRNSSCVGSFWRTLLCSAHQRGGV